MRRIMVDIETFGMLPTALIRSIGACDVAPMGATSFFAPLDIDQMDRNVFTTDDETVRFWAEQPDSAKAQFNHPVAPFHALSRFQTFADGADEVWANGINFDIPIIEHALRQYGLNIPWKYNAVRDFRTMRKLFPGRTFEHPKGAIEHHAYWDAVRQARELDAILATIGN